MPPIRNQSGTKLRRFVFTFNNWTPIEFAKIKTDFEDIAEWAIIGIETGESGTSHLQGACVLKKQTAFSTIKKILPKAHFEPMRGTPQDSIVYCSKEDPTPWIMGKTPEPGKRNDIHYAYDAIRDGASLKQLAQTNGVAVIKYHRGLTICRSLLQPQRDPAQPPKIYWCYGATGTGKTKAAYEFCRETYNDDEVLMLADSSLHWFDGYDGQRAVIIDDFRAKGTSFAFLLRVLDRYPLSVPIKGGFVNWTSDVIIITTPNDIRGTFEL